MTKYVANTALLAVLAAAGIGVYQLGTSGKDESVPEKVPSYYDESLSTENTTDNAVDAGTSLVEAELESNISTDHTSEKGMSQTEAEEAAVREMGDPVEVGLEMDRIYRPTMAWGMIALIVGLSFAGYLLRSVMYQTALGIEQSAGKTEELFWTGMSSSWHTSLELPALLLGLVLMIGIWIIRGLRFMQNQS